MLPRRRRCWRIAREENAESWHAQVMHQLREHGCVTGLAGAEQHDHRPAVSVDHVVDLGGQSIARAAEGVARPLGQQIRVIRPSPQRRG